MSIDMVALTPPKRSSLGSQSNSEENHKGRLTRIQDLCDFPMLGKSWDAPGHQRAPSIESSSFKTNFSPHLNIIEHPTAHPFTQHLHVPPCFLFPSLPLSSSVTHSHTFYSPGPARDVDPPVRNARMPRMPLATVDPATPKLTPKAHGELRLMTPSQVPGRGGEAFLWFSARARAGAGVTV